MRTFTIGTKEDLPPFDFTLALPPLPVPAPVEPVPEVTDGDAPAQETAPEPAKPAERSETFNCRGDIPSIILIDIERGGKTVREAATTVWNLFEASIVPEDYTRFRETLADPLNRISSTDIGQIYNYLYEQYTLPTRRA